MKGGSHIVMYVNGVWPSMAHKSNAAVPRRRGVDGERVHAAFEFIGKRLVYHAVAFEPRLAAKGFRHDRDPEMGLPARPMSGMAGVQVRFIDHVEVRGREGFGQLRHDKVADAHNLPA